MKNIWQKLNKISWKKSIFTLVLFSVVFSGFLGVFYGLNVEPASGALNIMPNSIESYLAGAIGGLVKFFVTLEGFILMMLTKILMALMRYNGFVNSYAVQVGWTLVRDVSNMFFVLVLLIISFATILKVESYNIKRLLPKVLLMAILVNFSRTICGLMIDFAQVAMMTFAASYAGIGAQGGASLIHLLKVDDILFAARKPGGVLSSNLEEKNSVDISSVIVTGLLVVVLLAIAVVVVLVMTVVIMMRMIMLWILLVLSPLPFILSAFPQGEKYAQQFWQEFSKYVIVGPIIAFFLWLSFAVSTKGFDPIDAADTLKDVGSEEVNSEVVFTGIGDPENFLQLIIGIGMLMASLMITQQLGVAGGSLAGAAAGKIKQTGMSLLKLPIKAASWAERRVYSGEVPLVGKYTRGWGFNPVRWQKQVSGYLERRKGEQEKMGTNVAGFKYATTMGKDRKGALGKTKGVIGRSLREAQLLLSSPADFLKYYGGIIRGTAQTIRTVTGKERVIPGFIPGLKRVPVEEGFVQLKSRRTKEEIAVMIELKAGKKDDETDDDWAKRQQGLELKLAHSRKMVVPAPYYAVEDFRSLVKEEISKLPENMETTEVLTGMDMAYRDMDVPKFLALMKKSANDYNDNEYLNHFKYTAASYGGKFWEDRNGVGLEEGGAMDFGRDILQHHFGLPEQLVQSFLNEIEYINEDRKHGGNARGHEVDDRGVFRAKDRIDQAVSIMNEYFKGAIRGNLGGSARLNYGGENSDGEYNMGLPGMMLLGAGAPDVVNYIARNEMNKSTLAKFQEDTETLDVAEKLESLIDEKGERLMPAGIVDLIRNDGMATQDMASLFKASVKGEAGDLKRWAEIIYKVGGDIASAQAGGKKISESDMARIAKENGLTYKKVERTGMPQYLSKAERDKKRGELGIVNTYNEDEEEDQQARTATSSKSKSTPATTTTAAAGGNRPEKIVDDGLEKLNESQQKLKAISRGNRDSQAAPLEREMREINKTLDELNKILSELPEALASKIKSGALAINMDKLKSMQTEAEVGTLDPRGPISLLNDIKILFREFLKEQRKSKRGNDQEPPKGR